MIHFLSEIYFNTFVCLAVSVMASIYLRYDKWYHFVILAILWINVGIDFWSTSWAMNYKPTAILHNAWLPLEMSFGFYIYVKAFKQNKWRISYLYWLPIALWLSNYFFNAKPQNFHTITLAISGFLFAVASYIYIRNRLLHLDELDEVLIFYALANMLYFALMVCSMTAQPLAQFISMSFAKSLKQVNNIGYIFWSLLIGFGILWNRKKHIYS